MENVRVVVRCRPFSEKEIADGYKNVVKVDALNASVIVENTIAGPGELPKTFSFDAAFGPESKQADVYIGSARAIVDNVLQGYNGTIFAYGQTGTGKSFTMEGDRSTLELKGIIPNSFAHIFGHIAKAGDDKKFLVRVSYLEIYNEEVHDLLGQNQNIRLEVKERPDIGVYVKDLTAFGVSSADHMDRIMTIGNRNRAVGATKMNERSSRSHAIFTIYVECSELGQEHVRMGKLHLVDLAGSERQSKTNSSGQTLKEATKINLSLSTLGNVISALVDGKSTHVPYRNSKLTRLLQDSLGGNSKTLMCASIGPADYNYDETISTLRYANRAKSIQNNAKINEDPKDALLRQFQKEIEELKRKLQEDGFESFDCGQNVDGNKEQSGDEFQNKKKGLSLRDALSEERMGAIRAEINIERQRLAENEGIAEEERKRLVLELQKREDEIKKTQEAHEQLVQRVQAIEKKILVGGENLLDKAEEQERLLEESARELEKRRQKETQLRQALQQKEAERLDIEEKYSNLQEEAAGKTKKLKKVWTMLVNAKSDLGDAQQENQRETEGLLENVRQLSRELRLQMLVIDSFIPAEYQDLIEQHVHWNEDIGEWQLKCVAYTGNNMRKQSVNHDWRHESKFLESEPSPAYLSYMGGSAIQVKQNRQKTATAKSYLSTFPAKSKKHNSDVEFLLQNVI